jgi:hypothetical protein
VGRCDPRAVRTGTPAGQLGGEVPAGARFHVIGFEGAAARVADVWDSAEDYQRFVDERLMPGVKQVGIEGEPQVEIFPTHAIFAPAYDR